MAQSTHDGGVVSPLSLTLLQLPVASKSTYHARPPLMVPPTPTTERGVRRVLMKAQSTNEQPLPNVQDDSMVTPMNTHESPYEAPGPIDPPLTTTASAMTFQEDTHDNLILPRDEPSTELETTQLTYSQREQIPKLAQDVVLYGDVHMAAILHAYKVSQQQFDEVISTSASYLAAAALTKRQLEDDPHLPDRMKARVMVSNLLPTLNTMANNTAVEFKDRLKAVEMLTNIADMGPRKQVTNDGNGMQVMINFGATLGGELSKAVKG
jgi:hypothetical protein